MKDIIDLAYEFAKNIQKTKEYLLLQEAKKNNDEDKNLNELIYKYNILKNNISQKKVQDEKNVQVKQAKKLYKNIMENKNMKKFNEASNNMNILMNKINSIFIAAVNGKQLTDCCEDEIYDCGRCGKCLEKN